jgi:hypothetical protein
LYYINDQLINTFGIIFVFTNSTPPERRSVGQALINTPADDGLVRAERPAVYAPQLFVEIVFNH